MGIPCRIVVAALTLAVFAAPIAAAHGPQKDGRAVVGILLGRPVVELEVGVGIALLRFGAGDSIERVGVIADGFLAGSGAGTARRTAPVIGLVRRPVHDTF